MTNKIIDKLVAEKLITKRKHPIHDIWILNYTPTVQFDKLWTNELLMCRGLVVDSNANIIARPFKKFFNFGEQSNIEIPDEDCIITHKVDGSLGILFSYNGHWIISTRGSFESEQAIYAQNNLLPKYNISKLKSDYTYLFEICYPENRIVCDYGDKKELVYLTAIDTRTGEDYSAKISPLSNIGITQMGCEIIEHSYFDSVPKLLTYMKENTDSKDEGFVIFYPKSDLRFKIKYEHYIEIHRIKSHFNEKHIWEALKNNTATEMFEALPDEFYTQFKEISVRLYEQYKEVLKTAKIDFESLKYELTTRGISEPTRKDLAQIILTKKYPSILFKMLDNKNYDELIWDIIEPKGDSK